MKLNTLLIFQILRFLVVGCASENPCPEGSITYIDDIAAFPQDLSASLILQPTDITIRGKTITVDRVVEGLICNDTWEGTVYVSCNVTLQSWDVKPTFFSNGCKLSIAPGTVVYVAAHNDAAYYKGCDACH